MSPGSRREPPFELLAFTATAVSAEIAVVELEGRLTGRSGATGRPPVLVVEAPDGTQAEIGAVRSVHDGDRWWATFAMPARALDARTYALGVRGALVELPEPDWRDEGGRLAALAREANTLRRRLEAAHARERAARAELDAADGERRAAVAAAEDDAQQRLAAQRAEHEAARDDLEARLRTAEHRAAEAEGRATAAERALAEAEAREAEARDAVAAADAGTAVLRTELAEERRRIEATVAALQEDLATARAVPAPDAVDPPTLVTPRPEDTRPLPLRTVDPVPEPDPASAAEPRPPSAVNRTVAILALVAFVAILLALLFGFLG